MIKEDACKKLIRDVEIFLKGNDVEYILDSDWRTRFLVLFFPNVSKTLTWLTYSMRTLKNSLEYVKKIHEEPTTHV